MRLAYTSLSLGKSLFLKNTAFHYANVVSQESRRNRLVNEGDSIRHKPIIRSAHHLLGTLLAVYI